VTLAVFGVAIFSRELVWQIPAYASAIQRLPLFLRRLEQPCRWSMLLSTALLMVHRCPPMGLPRMLGLAASPLAGIVVGFASTLPLFALGLLRSRLDLQWLRTDAAFYAGVWPLAEELLFRGYAVGQLCWFAGWGFWPAALVTSAVFGAVHMSTAAAYGLALAGRLGTVGVTAIGGVYFAWLMIRWNRNLWVPVFVHAFMNLWWSLFQLAESPLGPVPANVGRVACVLGGVFVTIVVHRRGSLRQGRPPMRPRA
jgi:membrane protease YdiL (CAAX protease family)